MNDISLFTSQPKAKLYDGLFEQLDISSILDRRCEKCRKGYSRHAMTCAVFVMKCECFSYITDLIDYLNNNLIIVYYYEFDITRKLPGYHALERFIKDFDNALLKKS